MILYENIHLQSLINMQIFMARLCNGLKLVEYSYSSPVVAKPVLKYVLTKQKVGNSFKRI